MSPVYPPSVSEPMVLPVMGIMTSRPDLADQCLALIEKELGPPEITADPKPFDYTDFYEPEMGPDLVRWYVAFAKLVPAESLVDLKYRTAEIEAQFASKGQRPVNLDPGYVEMVKVVLYSWKEGNYKIYLGRGVWADPVLLYEHGKYRTQDWTFPDLRAGHHLDFFVAARNFYKKLRRKTLGEP